MNTLNKLTIVITLIFATNGFAQNYKFGKVSKEELLEKSYKIDSTANAVVLYESRKIKFQYSQENGFQLITEVYKRIKLYNKKGFDEASEHIYLYRNNSDKEELNGLRAVTYSLINGEIVETKLKKDKIFKNEYSEHYNEVKFTMPLLHEGSVIEYKYKIVSPFARNIDKIYLQRNIAIKNIAIRISIPEYYHFKKFTSGYLPIHIKESVESDKIVLSSKSRSGFYATKTNYSQNTIEYLVNTYEINSKDTPAFKSEPFSGNTKNYMASIDFELQYTKFPKSSINNYSTSWEDVAKTIYNDSRFGNEIEKNSYFKRDIDSIINSESDPLELTNKIFDFVKKRMTWNKKFRVMTVDGVKKAYTSRVGNSAEINIMLVAMLKYAKIQANPVLVSSVNKTIALFPTLEGFDYLIVRVKSGDNIVYMDATDKFGEFNVLPNRVIQGSGRILSENGTSQLINFRPDQGSRFHCSIMCEIDIDGVVKGTHSSNRLSYLAHDFRVRYGGNDSNTQIKRVKEIYEINNISSYKLKGLDQLGKPLGERFEFVLENEIEIVGDEMFFSPLLFLRDKENLFKAEDRQYPIDFGYGYDNNLMVSIRIPEGYEVVEVPKPSAFKLPQNMGKFVYRINKTNNQIQVLVSETLNTPFVSPDNYQAIKEFYNQIIIKESEQVVLKKI
ncbi:transglutaminase domain-containing protein [Aquimarina sp. W85]|uniref:transglutaminase domain-containing protein n=1 Tax=Aquimarina rhodophyticola TaxID=3342246 RepID=UPI00366F0CD0